MTPADLALIGVDSETLAAAYGFGAGSVLLWWGLGFTIKVCIDLIKKI